MIHREKSQGLVDKTDDAQVAECLLPRILEDSGDTSTMRRIVEWLT
jgi:hypothetical protein